MVQVALKSFLLTCLVTSFVGGGSYLSALSMPGATHREVLLKALRAKLSAKSYRLKEVQSGSGEGVGIGIITTGNYVAPNKYHAIVEAVQAGTGKSELILLGPVTYAKISGGTWQRKQIDPQRIEFEFGRLHHAMLIDNLDKATDDNVKLAGQEELDGSTMFIYQYSFAGQSEILRRSQVKVWVGVNDGLPHRIEVESRMTQKGLKISFKTTTTYFDYNADMTIEAPI